MEKEKKGRRGEAIVNTILPEFLQEAKGTGALATTSPGTPEPEISLWDFMSLTREDSGSMQKDRAQVNDFELFMM